MPPKKRSRTSNDMSQTYYLPNNIQQQQQQQQQQQYGYYPPQYNNYNYNSMFPQQAPSQQDQESEIAQGALLLSTLKDKANAPPQPAPQVKKTQAFQRVFIHRVTTNQDKTLVPIESDARDDKDDEKPRDVENHRILGNENEVVLGAPNTKHSNADIIFANGNNREKRRVEMFENYSELYKFKEQNRDAIYHNQRLHLQKKLDLLSRPKNPNTEVAELNNDDEFFEQEQDLVEKRDFELTRLKNWRRYRRNENLKNYYKQSNEIYRSTNELLIDKLERLKQFFIKQKNLLNNLDREYTDISSTRAEKFYTGFRQEPQPHQLESFPQHDNEALATESDHDHLTIPQELQDPQTQDSSETDTGFTSTNSAVVIKRGPGRPSRKSKIKKPQSAKSKLNNTIMSSIIEGFAPILTNDEFQLVTNDETRTKINLTISTPVNSDTDSKKDQNGGNNGRTTTSSRAVREARDREGYRDNNAAMNKIMKHYVSPDELTSEMIDEDLKLLRAGAK
ncbi:unnamed protein product [Wickerhamomyces anomalus]